MASLEDNMLLMPNTHLTFNKRLMITMFYSLAVHDTYTLHHVTNLINIEGIHTTYLNNVVKLIRSPHTCDYPSCLLSLHVNTTYVECLWNDKYDTFV